MRGDVVRAIADVARMVGICDEVLGHEKSAVGLGVQIGGHLLLLLCAIKTTIKLAFYLAFRFCNWGACVVLMLMSRE